MACSAAAGIGEGDRRGGQRRRAWHDEWCLVGGLKYPCGVHWACWERAGTQPVYRVLAQHVLGCGLLAKPLNFPANREFGDQTQLKYGLILDFWAIAPGSRGNASQQPQSNPPDRYPAGTEETKPSSTGVVRQPARDVSVFVLSPHTASSCLPVHVALFASCCT